MDRDEMWHPNRHTRISKSIDLLRLGSLAYRSRVFRIGLVCCGAILWVAPPCIAGPCTSEIVRMQAQVDAKIEAIAKAGKATSESTTALLHHQPTPGSIANVEKKIGEGKGPERAIEALDKARAADRAGDAKACNEALFQARKALGD
jgi:hypothetical protein